MIDDREVLSMSSRTDPAGCLVPSAKHGGVVAERRPALGSGLKAVATVGDNQYLNGELANFESTQACDGLTTCGFNKSWGPPQDIHASIAIWAGAGFHDWQDSVDGTFGGSCSM